MTPHPRQQRYHPRSLVCLLLMAMAMLAGMVSSPTSGVAHANLATTDPTIDALLVSSPATIRMSFTEEVAATPAPVVRLLDAAGSAVPDDDLTISIDRDNPKVITVDVPTLDRGTWTVAWTVTSATDGHTLSGTWAFRIGGGLPPGQATSEDAAPATWAVALRWLTFLGVAGTAGLLLFPFLARYHGSRFDLDRTTILLAWCSALVALLASLLEPMGAWLSDRSLSFADHIASLPTAWNWRPLTLIPLVIGLSAALALRRTPGQWGAIGGALLALGSLLGLILTSHAAGRDTNRWLAVSSDALHQWSVALWTGGLLALAVWLFRRRGAEGPPGGEVRLGRLSTIALGLFVVGVVSGFLNTTFMLDLVERVRDDGFGVDAFSDLWTSRYGIVLLVKVALLVVPFALAVYHRGKVATLIRQSGQWVTSVPGTMRRTLRWELILVALVVLGGSALAMSSPPAQVMPAQESITLVSPTAPTPSDDSFLVHLTVDPAQVGDNLLTVRLTSWTGTPLPADPMPRITLAFTSLDHGTHEGGVTLTESAEGWVTSGLKLSLEGWWQITTTIQRAGLPNAFADFTFLLPDPNTQGFDAPPSRDSNPEAEALFEETLNRMTGWTSVRWTELIGSGLDVLVIGDFAVVEPGGDAPNAYSMDLLFSGSFAPTSTGAAPPAPTIDGRSSRVVGDQGWLRTTGDQWLEEPPTRFIPPSGWDGTYAGATSFQLGTPQNTDGVEYQILTFHLPDQPTSAEAWFVWWIDTESGEVVRINMISRMHYMTWLYHDINGDITIEVPVESESPPATPIS